MKLRMMMEKGARRTIIACALGSMILAPVMDAHAKNIKLDGVHIPVKDAGSYTEMKVVKATPVYYHVYDKPEMPHLVLDTLKKGVLVHYRDTVKTKLGRYVFVGYSRKSGFIPIDNVKKVTIKYGAYKRASNAVTEKRYVATKSKKVMAYLDATTNAQYLKRVKSGQKVQVLGSQVMHGKTYYHIRYNNTLEGFTTVSNLKVSK